MDYKKHYNLLIEKALNRNIECYTELHHIVPRCLGGSDEKSNLIKLTPEEHFIAHKLLTKIYPNNLKLLYALNFMSSPVAQRNLNNKSFGFVRKEISKLMQGDLNPIKRFPEKNHMSFDIYTCRQYKDNEDYLQIYNYLIDNLKASKNNSKCQIIDRYF